MTNLHGTRTIFFDYDGTLHNSEQIYIPAFRKALAYLAGRCSINAAQWTDSRIRGLLGISPPEIWRAVIPDRYKKERSICSAIVSSEMQHLIEQGRAELYPGALDTLDYLKRQGYVLVFISNCKQYYMKSHTKLFQLDQFFEIMVCSETYDFKPKSDIITSILPQIDRPGVIIGDRKQDIDAGRQNRMTAVGCLYGFSSTGELDEADYTISDIAELKRLL